MTNYSWQDSSTRQTIQDILKKVEPLKNDSDLKLTIIDFPQLRKLLSPQENKVIEKVLTIDPQTHGFHGNYLGIEPVPKNLIPVRNQIYKFRGKEHKIPMQYLLPEIYKQYQSLNHAIKTDLGKQLLIGSSYRSPAYQVITFLYYLNVYDFDFSQTIRRVAMPAYSEHCSSTHSAIDLITKNGLPSDKHPLNFARTVEYRWLRNNAHKFRLEESYPKNNAVGIMFEPWHWRLITN